MAQQKVGGFMGQIHELLPKVMADIGAIEKLQRNKSQNFNFRGIDDALSHCNPVLAKHGVSVSVSVREYKTATAEQKNKDGYVQHVTRVSLLMAVSFMGGDGSIVENVLAGEAMDYADKATNKAMAAAFKYGMFFGLVIPVERQSIDDSDRTPDEEPYQHREPADATEPAMPPPKKQAKADSVSDKTPAAEAVSLLSKGLSAVANAHTLEDLTALGVKAEKYRETGQLTMAESTELLDATNKRCRQISGREKATA